MFSLHGEGPPKTPSVQTLAVMGRGAPRDRGTNVSDLGSRAPEMHRACGLLLVVNMCQLLTRVTSMMLDVTPLLRSFGDWQVADCGLNTKWKVIRLYSQR